MGANAPLSGSRFSGAASVLANARAKGGFGRSAGFLNAVAAARQEVREPAQHTLQAPHVGHPPEKTPPAHSGPDFNALAGA